MVHILNKKLKTSIRIGYCELATLAGMLLIPDDFSDFYDISSFDRIGRDIFYDYAYH